MSILIHIGYPKTATTWFQKSFFPSIKKDYNIVSREDIVEYLIRPNALDFNARKARSYFIEKYGTSCILSFEGFAGTTHNFGLHGYMTKEHALRLHSTFPEAKIILFIRRQADLIASSYTQYITGGGTFSINKFLYRPYFIGLNSLPLFSLKFFEFDKIIRLYYNLFSKENVDVYLYEEFAENTAEFIQNFSKRYQICLPDEPISFKPLKIRLRKGMKYMYLVCNLFSSRKMLNKYYLINIPYWFAIYKPVLAFLNNFRIFGKAPSSRQILGKKNYEKIIGYYKTSNTILDKEFDIKKLKKYNYPFENAN